jgi:hypothetical protein
MYRNEIEIRTVEGHDVLLTLRRFGLINKDSRKEMLRRRRIEQLSRVGGERVAFLNNARLTKIGKVSKGKAPHLKTKLTDRQVGL